MSDQSVNVGQTNRSGSSNTTTVIGGEPCHKCGEREAAQVEFHGWRSWFCNFCGEELPHA